MIPSRIIMRTGSTSASSTVATPRSPRAEPRAANGRVGLHPRSGCERLTGIIWTPGQGVPFTSADGARVCRSLCLHLTISGDPRSAVVADDVDHDVGERTGVDLALGLSIEPGHGERAEPACAPTPHEGVGLRPGRAVGPQGEVPV